MRAVLAYALASALLLPGLAAVVIVLARTADAGAVWLAAGIAWPVQLMAFGALVKGRQGGGFLASWAAGMALRFVVVAAAALWVTRVDGRDPESLLLSLVGFVFVLVLFEPLFLRLTD